MSNLPAALLRLCTGLGERDRLADSDLLCADLHAISACQSAFCLLI